jgi:hypothetical protein
MNVRLAFTGLLLAGIGVLSGCGESDFPVAPRHAQATAPAAAAIGDNDLVPAYEEMPAALDAAVTVASVPVPHFSVVILASQFKMEPPSSHPHGR